MRIEGRDNITRRFSTRDTDRRLYYSARSCCILYHGDQLVDLTLRYRIVRAESEIFRIDPAESNTIIDVFDETICLWDISEFFAHSNWTTISMSDCEQLDELCTSYRAIRLDFDRIVHHSCSDECLDRTPIDVAHEIASDDGDA